jgi:hypothetical protein
MNAVERLQWVPPHISTKIIPRSHSTRLRRHGEHCCPCCRTLPGPHPRLAPSAGLVVVQASRQARCGPEGKMSMANQQTSKQVKTAAKVDTGETKKLARTGGERQPRRRSPRARSEAPGGRTEPAAGAARAVSDASSERSDVSSADQEPSEQAVSPSEPVSQGADAPTSSVAGADRPRASTKRAMLIAMLERAEGASVAEMGQRLGWLPHTVRAAITGLRHAGREVTRGKDQSGQSVYRFAPVETPDR